MADQQIFACSLKVSYSSDSATKAVLLKDKPSKSPKEDSPPEPQQYIEVGRVLAWHTSHPDREPLVCCLELWQVWSEGNLLNTIDVKSLKKHGKINEDGKSVINCCEVKGCHKVTAFCVVTRTPLLPYTRSAAHFGSFQLSASGEWLLYIAEREKAKAISYFKKGNC